MPQDAPVKSSPRRRYLLSVKSYLVVVIVLAGFTTASPSPKPYDPWGRDPSQNDGYHGHGWPMVYRCCVVPSDPLFGVPEEDCGGFRLYHVRTPLGQRDFPVWQALSINILFTITCALLGGLASERFLFRRMRQAREAQE